MRHFQSLEDEIEDNIFHIKQIQDEQLNRSPFIEIHNHEVGHLPFPNEMEKWRDEVKQKRMVVFSEHEELDIYQLQRQIAFNIGNNGQFKVKEMTTQISVQYLMQVLEEEPSDCIFMMGQQEPKTLGHNLEKIQSLATRKNFWFIAQTNRDKQVWANSPYVLELNPFSYDPEELTQYLGSILNMYISILTISKDLINELSESRFQQQLCTKLTTPLQIDLFIQHLVNQTGVVNKQGLDFAIAAALEEKYSPLIRSFKSQNDYRKLIALGLVLFDGLYDDQFFSAMSYLVNKSWKGRAKQLRSLDYCDLEAVSSFFNYNNIVGNERFIQNKSVDQRKAIIEYAWNSYRRHLLSALPILAELVIQSVTAINSNWELFGTKEKRIRLRSSIADTISDLGLKAPDSVEHTLIQLACHNSYVVQLVAANALARWYQLGHHDLFFSLIEKWQQDEKFVNLVINILTERHPGERRTRYQAMGFIKATILLTLGKAAEIERGKEALNPKIIKTLEHALQEKNELVKTRFSQILPEVVHLHLEVLWKEKLLSKLIDQDHLIYSVAVGLAKAYRDTPKKVERLFDKWLPLVNNRTKWAKKNSSIISENRLQRWWKQLFNGVSKVNLQKQEEDDNDESLLDKRDRVAITLILVCKEIALDKGLRKDVQLCGMSPNEILFNFRNREENYIVREVCLQVLVYLIEQANDDVAQNLLHEEGPFSEKQAIAMFIGRRYLFERYLLKGGEEELILGRRNYSIWIDKSSRPDVAIEGIVKKWLSKGNHDQMQLALLSLSRFVKEFEFQEDILIEKILQKQEEASKGLEYDQDIKHRIQELFRSKINDILYYLRKRWVTLFKSTNTSNTLIALSPILRSYYFSPNNLRLISEKLKRDEEIPDELIQGIEQLYKINDK